MISVHFNKTTLSATASLDRSGASQATAMERLSSGLRINSASDDAAGLAISTRFTTQLKGLDKAYQNTSDGVSLVNIATESVSNLQNQLQRIRELAVQAANAVNSDADRVSLDLEASQLLQEFSRVVETTSFNGLQIFQDSPYTLQFQVGENSGDLTELRVAGMGAKNLGDLDPNRAIANGTSSQTGAHDLKINGIYVPSSNSALDTVSTTASAASAIAKAAAINKVSDKTGVAAEVRTNVAKGSSMTGFPSTGTVTINDVEIAVQSTGTDTVYDRQRITEAVNSFSSESGVYAINTKTDVGGVRLASVDGRNIHIESTVPDVGTGLPATGSVTYGSYELISTESFTLEQGDFEGNIDNTGLVEMEVSNRQFQMAAYNSSTAAISTGDLVINNAVVGASLAAYDPMSTTLKSASAISKATAINQVSATTGVVATANDNLVNGAPMIGNTFTGFLIINNIFTDTFTATLDQSTSRKTVTAAINSISLQTGVQAINTSTDEYGLQLKAIDGRNIEISKVGAGTDSAVESATGVNLGVHISTFDLRSDSYIDLATNTGDIENAGLNLILEDNGHENFRLKDLSIATQEDAAQALQTIDMALEGLLQMQTSFGATLSRFESSMNANTSSQVHISQAKSRVLDADIAKETAALTKSEISKQAATKMFAGATLEQQMVLLLLE